MACARILGAHSPKPLDGTWQLAALPPAPDATPTDLARLDPSWIDCAGPMPAAAALRAAGRWDLDHPRDFDAEDWWYRCRFSSAEAGEPVRLRFDGLATIVDVWLNGHLVLHSENMFIASIVEVEHGLAEHNELLFHFHALRPRLASGHPRPAWRTRMVSHQALRWYRTTLLGRCPAWCPPVAPVGPWRPIAIETTRLRLEQAQVRADVDGDEGLVRLSLRVACPSTARITGTLTVGDWNAPAERTGHSERHSTIEAAMRVPCPQRWWPHTHGTPALYDVHVSLVVGDVAETIDLGRVGFRSIDLDRGPDGEGFGLIVNGTPVFCRGVCWTPLDLARLSAEPDAYRIALGQLRDAGTNMIRVCGTMTYEADAFHDLCDELGILIFQDFMFASMDYPWDDEEFARSVLAEAAQMLERLQSRPSIAIVCASSEIEQQAAMLGQLDAHRRHRVLDEQLPDLVRTLAPSAVWLPGTPSGGAFPFQVNAGVSHYYGVGAYRRPFEDARQAGVRFCAECLAFSNIPDGATVDDFLGDGGAPGPSLRWKARIPRDAGASWDFEEIRDHYVERLFGIDAADLAARDPERYLALGRVATGEAMQRTFAEWRRPGSTCRGGLIWFARDLWDGAGWGIIDAGGRAKAAYWYLKRALAPVALLTADEGLNGLWFHAVNDTPEAIAVDLHVALYRDGARRGAPVRTTVEIPGHGSRSIHADALFGQFLDLTYAYRFGPPGHDVVAATLYDASSGAARATACYVPNTLPVEQAADLGLTARAEPAGDGYELVLETARFAHAVAIDVDGWIADDNYLHVEPESPRRIALRPARPGAVLRGRVAALNGRSSVPLVIMEPVDARR